MAKITARRDRETPLRGPRCYEVVASAQGLVPRKLFRGERQQLVQRCPIERPAVEMAGRMRDRVAGRQRR